MITPDVLQSRDAQVRTYRKAQIAGDTLMEYETRFSPNADLIGKEVSYEVEAEDTGEVFTVTEDVSVALKSIDERLQALKDLRACL